MLTSTVCRFEHFGTEWYRKFALRLRLDDPSLPDESRRLHRKVWEFCAIAQTLEERGVLQAGRKGLGFAVGQEPLPALFASYGPNILATDLATEQSKQGWIETRQHASTAEVLFDDFLIDRASFEERVTFRFADMRSLLEIFGGQFDFLWSSCALEHLGSLEAGLQFVLNAMRLLKPGGLAVHTTEYNVSSNEATVADGDAVIYRKRDIEELGYRLRAERCGLGAVDYDAGTHPHDLNPDIPPYYVRGRQHIKLEMSGFVTTSMLLIVFKG